ncbi:S8 family peptidase [Roseateles sp. LYH14W]|uniref:S8 family serine peptidase n=1 Tax=Pelomonas parva TaxID=3299032 RepID=A0ABW7EXG9_9BURK
MTSTPKFPKRFVVIPQKTSVNLDEPQKITVVGLGQFTTRSPAARRSFQVAIAAPPGRGGGATQVKILAARPAALQPAPGLKVVKTSPTDCAVLVEGGNLSLTEVQEKSVPGAKVFQEQWYRLDRPARPWRKLSTELKKPRVKPGHGATYQVKVVVDGPKPIPLADALVTVMLNSAKGIGLEVRTDTEGIATFVLSKSTSELESVAVEPLHSAWPVALLSVSVPQSTLTVKVPALAIDEPDARNKVYGKAKIGDGKKVRVGVIDTGVGKHAALTVLGGMNTTGESATLYTDEEGHGTHVAGVIASSASGWRRGEAPKVELLSYRIFKSGAEYASTFDISTAIKQAAADGCDLINLSIGGAEDGAVKDAIDLAWEAGCVCIAATGNDGHDNVDYPAGYKRCLAVSAIGLEASWPAGTYIDWTLSKVTGKQIAGSQTFFASFSNRGSKVAMTAPGVAIVSTIFGDRWGVMSGTSMASPIATGVVARGLAGSLAFDLPRDAARSQAIVDLALANAEDLGFTASRQGKGLAR